MRLFRSSLDVLFAVMSGLTVFSRMGYVQLGVTRVNYMTAQQFADLAAGIKDVATTIAIFVGGLWAFRRFWRERESVPRLQLELTIDFVHQSGAAALIAISAHIENKGKVRHEIRKFDFHLSVLNHAMTAALQPISPVEFPIDNVTGSLMPKDSEYSFIEPAVRVSYYELVAVPSDADVVYVYSRFDYGETEYEEAECAVSRPHDNGLSKSSTSLTAGT